MTRKYPPAVSSVKSTEHRAPAVPRLFERAVIDLPAQYVVEGDTEWRSTVIDDLGGGGVRLQTADDVAAGTIVSLRFDIEGTPISVTARVAMSVFDSTRARFFHGVAFTAIDPADQQVIVRRVSAIRDQTAHEK